MTGAVLVMAKAPVPGMVKTRLARTVGPHVAADLACAALLDTLDVCSRSFARGRRYLALSGSVDHAVGADRLRYASRNWCVIPQHGVDFAHRLADAHRRVHAAQAASGRSMPVTQIGMDTPQVAGEVLLDAAARADDVGLPALGLAEDGGWWVLASTTVTDLAGLEGVPMSHVRTGQRTRELLRTNAGGVVDVPVLRDVDDVDDADAVAEEFPDRRFAAAWRAAQLSSASARRGSGRDAGGRVRDGGR